MRVLAPIFIVLVVLICLAIIGAFTYRLTYYALSSLNTRREDNHRKRIEEGRKREQAEIEVAKAKALEEEKRAEWTAIITQGDEVSERWVKMSTDLEFVLNHPLVANVNEPLVKDMITTVTEYRLMRSEKMPSNYDHMWASPLGKHVKSMTVLIDSVVRQANAIKDKNYAPAERKKLAQAQNLLSLAMNTGASPNERQLAYERLKGIMEELSLHVAPETLVRVEIGMRDMNALESGK